MIKLKVKVPKLKKTFQDQMPSIIASLAATVQTNRGMLFDKEGAHNGHERWKPLKYRRGKILQDTGNLRRSIAPRGGNGHAGPNGIVRVDSRIVFLQTNVEYAGIHEDGSRLQGVVKGSGKHQRKPRNIPSRPFMQKAWNSQDQDEVVQTMTRKLEKLLQDGWK
jgi:phage gpG-like protein